MKEGCAKKEEYRMVDRGRLKLLLNLLFLFLKVKYLREFIFWLKPRRSISTNGGIMAARMAFAQIRHD